MDIVKWILANWAVCAAGALIVVRLIESYMITKKLDWTILKEFLTLR